MKVQHKGWNWSNVDSVSWDNISEDFLPVALEWSRKFNSFLDVGAGKGRHALFFARQGFDVSAVDLSQDGIDYINSKATQEGVKVNTSVADMTELPYSDESFDGVICFHTIYHSNYEGVKKALSEIYRVLKPGGEAYITFNAKDNPKFKEEESLDGYTMIEKEGNEEGIPHCYVNVGDVMELLEDFLIISMNETINFVRRAEKAHGIHFYVHVAKNK